MISQQCLGAFLETMERGIPFRAEKVAPPVGIRTQQCIISSNLNWWYCIRAWNRSAMRFLETRVEGVITGSDGQIRGATVRIHSSGNRTILLRRPLQLLYHLEVRSGGDTNSSDVSHTRTTESFTASGADQSHHDETSPNKDVGKEPPEASRIGWPSQRMAARNSSEIMMIQWVDSWL